VDWEHDAREIVKSGNYRIPDLQLDLVVLDGEGPRAELDADRQVVDGLEALVGELEQKARLADSGVANDNVFEEILVGKSLARGRSSGRSTTARHVLRFVRKGA
jgi:hypothetical protein